jgi:hypothetical protein
MKCDYMGKDEKYPICYRQSAFGIYAFVVKEECLKSECYTNIKEQRKLKLKNINDRENL